MDINKKIQPKRKKNPIATVSDVMGGKLNKIIRIILKNIRMPQIVNEMRDMASMRNQHQLLFTLQKEA